MYFGFIEKTLKKNPKKLVVASQMKYQFGCIP